MFLAVTVIFEPRKGCETNRCGETTCAQNRCGRLRVWLERNKVLEFFRWLLYRSFDILRYARWQNVFRFIHRRLTSALLWSWNFNDDAFSSIFNFSYDAIRWLIRTTLCVDQLMRFTAPLTSNSLNKSCTYAFRMPKDFPHEARIKITTKSVMKGAKSIPPAISSNIFVQYSMSFSFQVIFF